jgi:hypothetical protein
MSVAEERTKHMAVKSVHLFYVEDPLRSGAPRQTDLCWILHCPSEEIDTAVTTLESGANALISDRAVLIPSSFLVFVVPATSIGLEVMVATTQNWQTVIPVGFILVQDQFRGKDCVL